MKNYEFSWLDLFPYLVSFVIIAILYNSKMPKQKRCGWIFVYVLLLTAFRYGIGYDFFSYKNTIIGYDEYQFQRIEILGSMLMRFSYFTHYQVFFVVTSILTLFPLYYCLNKYSKAPDFSFLLFLLFPLFYLNFIGIARNAVSYAFGICMFCALYFGKGINKYLIASVCFMIAFGFHKSSVILLLLALLTYVRIGKVTMIVIYILSFVISNIVVEFLSSYSSLSMIDMGLEYLSNHSRAEGQMMTYVINALCISTFFVWDSLSDKNKVNNVYLRMCCVGTCLWNIFLPLESTIALRFSTFFTLFYLFLIPEIINMRCLGFVIKRVHILTVLLLLMAFTFYRNIDAKGNGYGHIGFLPYQTVFYHTDYVNYQD